MKRILTAAVFALTLAALVLPATAGATESYQFRFRGLAASALFTADDGCVVTAVFVHTGQVENQTPPGAPAVGAYAFVDAIRYDYCTGVALLDARGRAENVAVWVDQRLEAATLQATIDAYDAVTQSAIALDVNLGWGATGGVARGNWHETYQADGVTVNEHGTGLVRPAVAAGSVAFAGTDLTPFADESAHISSTKSGAVSVDHNG